MTLNEDFGGPVELSAAFNSEDQETFLGLLAAAPSGMYIRGDGSWHTLEPNNRFFIGAMLIDVDEDFLDFFDKMDMKGVDPTSKQVMSFALENSEEEEGVEE